MIVVLVLTQQTIIRPHIPLQPGVIGTGRVNHNALDRNLATRLVAGILGED